MKKKLACLTLLAALALAAPLAAQTVPTSFNSCDNTRSTQTYIGQTSGTSAVQIVPGLSAAHIYVCSLIVINASGTTPTFSLVTGSQSNCAQNQIVFLGAFSTPAQTPVIFPGPYIGATAGGLALCYLQTGTTPVSTYILVVAEG